MEQWQWGNWYYPSYPRYGMPISDFELQHFQASWVFPEVKEKKKNILTSWIFFNLDSNMRVNIYGRKGNGNHETCIQIFSLKPWIETWLWMGGNYWNDSQGNKAQESGMDRTGLGQYPAWRNLVLYHIQCKFLTVAFMKGDVLCNAM
jgi:hypothetical protein